MSQHPPLPRLDEILARAEAGYRKTALADLRRYVGLNPDNLEAWLALGRLEDSPRAQKRALSRALALDPLNEEALRLYEALLEENPKLARRSYWRELGVGVLAGLVLLSLAVTAFLIFSSTRGEGSVVLVPTSRIVTSTVAPLQAATPLPTASAPPPPSPTFQAPVPVTGIVSATPPPSSASTTRISPVTGAALVLLSPWDGADTAEIATALSAVFGRGDVVFLPTDALPSNPAEALQVITGQAGGRAILYPSAGGLSITVQEAPYENRPQAWHWWRRPSPYTITLPLTPATFSEPLNALHAVLGYALGYPEVTMEALAGEFSGGGRVLDETALVLAEMTAHSALLLEDYETAADLYETLNAYGEFVPSGVAVNRALTLGMGGNLNGALGLLEVLAITAPEPALVQVALGVLRALAGDSEAAKDAYSRALTLDPLSPRPYVGRGLLAAQNGDENSALADFSAARALAPDYALPLYESARVRLGLALDDLALQDLNQALAQAPLIGAYYALRGQLFLRRAAWEDARADLETAVRLGAGNAPTQADFAHVLYQLGELGAALRASQAAILADPAYAEGYLWRAYVALAQDRPDDALKDLERGLDLAPDNAALWVGACTAHARLGDDGAAAQACDSALALDNNNALALEQRGLIRHRAGDRAGAESDFLEATLYAPDVYQAQYYLGLYALQAGDLTTAITRLSAAIKVNAAFGEAYAARAVAYRLTRAWELAVADAEQALKLVPEDVYSYYELGLSKRFLADRAFEAGNRTGAQILYQEAAQAFLSFLNASQPEDPFVLEAQVALAYVQNALAVIAEG